MTDPEPIRRSPPLSIGIAAVAATVAALLVVSVPTAAGFGALGTILMIGGLLSGSRLLVDLSGSVLALTVIVGGSLGVGPASISVAALAAVVAFDVGDHAHDLGQQVGRDTRTRRNELTHAGGSLFVGGIAGTIAYAVFFAMAGGQPTTALAFLLCGAIALVVALR